MGSKPIIIAGEASETDSEDESNLKTQKKMAQSVQGAVVTGEDSESENENDASISSAVSALNQSSIEDKPCSTSNKTKYDSLLHQKLKEYNTRLHSDMESYCQNTVSDAGKQLGIIDQQLLRSQLTLQNAVTSIKSLSVNSLTVKNKLHFLLSAKFFPNVKVSK